MDDFHDFGSFLAVERGFDPVADGVEDVLGVAVVVGEDSKERVRFGLNALKNVGSVCTEEIVKARKKDGRFTSLENFI